MPRNEGGVPETQRLTRFDSFLFNKLPLEGLDSFVRSIPELTVNRLTDCGVNVPLVFFYEENTKNGILPGELHSVVGYRGFEFYWAGHDNKIITRMRYPQETLPKVIAQDRDMLDSLLSEFYAKYAEERKFTLARGADSKGHSIAVETSLIEGDRAEGSVGLYWKNYYGTIMKPFISMIPKPEPVIT
jgi:hypothetical protein